MNKLTRTAGTLITLLMLHSAGTAVAGVSESRLWITDSGTRTVYYVSVDGSPSLISSFSSPENARSGLTVDPFDGTLWAASEQKLDTIYGSIVHFGRDGSTLSEIGADLFGAFGVEGVAVDYFDNSLWVVDDPISAFPGEVPTVHHIEKDGTPISSFATSTFDPGAKSPQAIAADPFDGTLWLTDNKSDKVYNIERDGTLIASFAATDYDTEAKNVQGISVDQSDQTLWVTDRVSNRIYNVTRTGDLISFFDSTDFDINANNPTAIAYEPRGVTSVPEPATLAIFSIGLAGLGFMRRRRAV